MKSIESIVKKQHLYFETNATKSVTFRKEQLLRLKAAVLAHEADVLEALKNDLNKAPFEAFTTEIGIVISELSYMIRHIDRFAKPKRVCATLAQMPASCRILPEPYGTVLILSPWNYPFQLALLPLIGAMAAGNCAIVKPSSKSTHTTTVIRRILESAFPPEYIDVVEGGRDAHAQLLEQKYDYIFFTGSISAGKTVMAAAAKHLTPITLELSGKSPCIVDETANIPLAARRIAWGKWLNAGQTCVAPDYVIAHRSIKAQLVDEILRYTRAFYGDRPHEGAELPKIISRKHFDRLLTLIASESDCIGGAANPATLQIEPALLPSANWKSAAMQEEIFGPVLPVLTYDTLPEVIENIKARPKPLALYLFTNSPANKHRVLKEVSFGGGCINDTVMHLASSRLPFGGVGDSGIGRYHGKASFETFSHMKSILTRGTFTDIPLRYPPYKNKLKLARKVFR